MFLYSVSSGLDMSIKVCNRAALVTSRSSWGDLTCLYYLLHRREKLRKYSKTLWGSSHYKMIWGKQWSQLLLADTEAGGMPVCFVRNCSKHSGLPIDLYWAHPLFCCFFQYPWQMYVALNLLRNIITQNHIKISHL